MVALFVPPIFVEDSPDLGSAVKNTTYGSLVATDDMADDLLVETGDAVVDVKSYGTCWLQ
jgi:hypothetical protein